MLRARDRSGAAATYPVMLLHGLGQGAIAPVIAISARELGASVAVASLIVALVGVGQLAGDLPAGSVASRVGERTSMLVAVTLVVPALAVCATTSSIPVFAAAVLSTGFASALWGLALQSHVTGAASPDRRGRTLSTLGGMHRTGTFLGPVVGAAVMSQWGTDAAYWLFAVAALAAAVGVLRLPHDDGPDRRLGRPQPVLPLVRQRMTLFRTLGLASVLVGAVRASRPAVIPLWGTAIGLEPAAISLVFALSGAVDVLLFYPAGRIMDRHGPIWVAVPSMLLMGGSLAALPSARTTSGFAICAVVVGIGNGLGSGLVMTLGADVAPKVGRAAFIGAWRLCIDTGNAGGPMLVGALTAVAGLATATWAIGGVGVLAAVAMYRWIPPSYGHGTPRPCGPP